MKILLTLTVTLLPFNLRKPLTKQNKKCVTFDLPIKQIIVTLFVISGLRFDW